MECDRSLWYPGYARRWECKLGPEAAFLKFHFSPGGACREVNLTLKFLLVFFFFLPPALLKEAIMQHILSKGAARWELLSHAPFITQNYFFLVQVCLPRLIGLTQPGRGKVADTYSMGTCRTSHLQFPKRDITDVLKKWADNSGRCLLSIYYAPRKCAKHFACFISSGPSSTPVSER